MGSDHFDYLLESSPQPKVASDKLELLARSAAKQYLEDGVKLNDSIAKFASESDLNRHQVERVCEMANIATHQGLWEKTAQKDTVVFPLADAKLIIKVVPNRELPLHLSAGERNAVDSCYSDVDYFGSPRGIPSPGPSMNSMFGVDPSQCHHGLTQEPDRKRIIMVMQKRAYDLERLKNDVLYRGIQMESAEAAAYEQVKQAALGGMSFPQIYRMCVSGGLQKVAEEYLPKFEERLISSTHGEVRVRLEKTAIAKAPKELISEDLGNTTVINGAHPVLVSLDTVQKKTDEVKNGIHNMLRIQDELKVYDQKLKELQQ